MKNAVWFGPCFNEVVKPERTFPQFTDIPVNSQFNCRVTAVPTAGEMIYAEQRHGKLDENKDGHASPEGV